MDISAINIDYFCNVLDNLCRVMEIMTENIANILTMRLISNELIDKKDKEIYQYSIQVWIEKMLGILMIICLAVIFRVLVETLLFLLFFAEIRKRTGGYHTNSFLTCFIGSIGIYAGYVKLIYPLLNQYLVANISLVLIASIVIWIIGAVNHPNMEWNDMEYKRTKLYARINVLIELLCIGLAIMFHIKTSYILFMSYGIILSAILLVLGKIIKQEV